MKEDFVTYELAVKLRKKGFNIDTDFCYNQDGGIVRVGTCPAPQIHEVLKWLREEKKLFVEPSLFKYGYESYVQSTIFEEDKDYADTWRVEGFHSTYERAAIAGIKYVIDNLI